MRGFASRQLDSGRGVESNWWPLQTTPPGACAESGANGFYVVNAKWSPDSQFFVFSMSSSGGHSPWSFPIMVYGRKKDLIAKFSDMIGGKPTLSADFDFSGPHTLVARTWKAAGAIENPIPVTVDLDAAFGKLPPVK